MLERAGARLVSGLAYGPMFLLIGLLCMALPADTVYNEVTVYTRFRLLLVYWGTLSTGLYLLATPPARRRWMPPLRSMRTWVRATRRRRLRSIKRYVISRWSNPDSVDYYPMADRADYAWELS